MLPNYPPEANSLTYAQKLDAADQLQKFRQEFQFPTHNGGQNKLYFAGHSLGLMPKKAVQYVNEELEAWGKFAVEGHFSGRHPWLPYHENITASFAKLVGAKPAEVVAMNTLTVNLHLMLISFYQPTKTRFKILIENNPFPSDKYAVDSQAKLHGFNVKEAVVELTPGSDGITVDQQSITQTIKQLGSSLSLVLLGNCQYLSGQNFAMAAITQAAHDVGAKVGFNLAHGAGNIPLSLHDEGVDFAVWCTYKYLNSGPGGIAGAFVHEKHHQDNTLPKLTGWWGHDKKSRFKMAPEFEPILSAESWQLSNPPIWQLASLRAAMELFDEATMLQLQQKAEQLTAYFDWLLTTNLPDQVQIITPENRGSMLCLRFKHRYSSKIWLEKLHNLGGVVDFREPDIIRATPVPLYNNFSDVYQLVELFQEVLHE